MRQRQARPRLLQAMVDAFRLPDLRRRILFTVGMLVVFRFVAHVPLPGVDPNALADLFQRNAMLGMLDMFSGGAMRNFSVAAMGVYPYITATIIMQLMVPVIPRLQAISQEGETGRNKINLITHWLTVPMAGLAGYGQLVLLQREGVVGSAAVLPTVAIVLSLVAGTMFCVWLGELITEYGIGNGISIIIFGGIVAGFICYWATTLKRFIGYDDALDAFGIHGVAGILGAVLTGVAVSAAIDGIGYGQGITMMDQVGIQLLGVLSVLMWSGCCSFIILYVLEKTIGLRVVEKVEMEGLDYHEHGEVL